MGQRCIKIGRLLTDFTPCLIVLHITYLSHQVDAVGNHDQNHTHVLSERQQQIAEVFAFDHRVLFVQFLNAV